MDASTAAPAAGTEPASSGGGGGATAAAYVPCSHYDRMCQLQCPRAGCGFFPCRFCHDAAKLDNLALDPKLQHALDRRAVTAVKCMACLAVQAPARACGACGTVLGAYFCAVCNLFDNVDKGQFHCEGCGMCRSGGADKFSHCEGCKTCIPRASLAQHKCIEGAMQADCPICCESMFTSRKGSSLLRCGHYVHSECHEEFLSTHSTGDLVGQIKRCPFCQASVKDHRQLWRLLDQEVLATPMAEEIRTAIRILCNDCHKESVVRWHCVAQKCPGAGCGGYNTRQMGGEVKAGPGLQVEEALHAGGGGGGGGGGGLAELGFGMPAQHVRSTVEGFLAGLQPVQADMQHLHDFLRALLGPAVVAGAAAGAAAAAVPEAAAAAAPAPAAEAAAAPAAAPEAAAAPAAPAAAAAAAEPEPAADGAAGEDADDHEAQQLNGLILEMVAALVQAGLGAEEVRDQLADAGYMVEGGGEWEDEEDEEDEEEEEEEEEE